MAPNPRANLRWLVLRLRREGYTYDEIIARTGIPMTTARRWVNPERFREHDRRAARRSRHPCAFCGYLTKGHEELCRGCIENRRKQIEEWWSEGLTLQVMADRLGWSKNHVGVEVVRMRQIGYELPKRRPYYGNGR